MWSQYTHRWSIATNAFDDLSINANKKNTMSRQTKNLGFIGVYPQSNSNGLSFAI